MTASGDDVQYDPFDPATIEEPFETYARLREHAPVYHNAQRGLWALSRHSDVRAALRDHERFSSTEGVGYERRPVPMMIAYDPPEHTRLRRIVQRDFVPKAVERWTPLVDQVVGEVLDDLLARGEADLSEVVAGPLPIAVIAAMLGVPNERRADFKRWSDATIDALGGGLDPEASQRTEATIMEFAQYCSEVIEERKGAPGDDLVSLLLAPRSGEELDEWELVSFTVLLMVAGNETTTNLIGNLVHALVREPELWERLRASPELVDAAVEEVLRYDSPIQGFFRTTTVPVELHGVTIPAGEKVMMLYGSANRDPAVFPDPDRLDLDRDTSAHLAFGAGIHVCLGAPLARLEVTKLLRAMLARVERFEVAGAPQRTANPLLRGMRRLPVRVTPR